MLKIYTDGACSGNPGPGGWAFVIPELGEEVSGYYADTTNNKMEILAVSKALEYLNQFYPRRTEVEIITDSQYVIYTMTKGWKKNKNAEFWDVLEYYLGFFTEVKWTWVKGHADNPYNQKCDKLAVDAHKLHANEVVPKALKQLNYNEAEWQIVEDEPDVDGYICSNCGYSALNDYRGQSTASKFCPHCGRYMINHTQPED